MLNFGDVEILDAGELFHSAKFLVNFFPLACETFGSLMACDQSLMACVSGQLHIHIT